MTKTKRAMKEDMRPIDLVIELVDARVPLSSQNLDAGDLGAGRTRMVLLDKPGLAGEGQSARWVAWLEDEGIHVVKIDARNKGALKQVQFVIQETYKEKIERDRCRDILNCPIRTMVVRIPNMGKSAFINSFAGGARAKTGNKPGVTKGNQWIRLNRTLELLDAPSILWPRFGDQQVGLKLAPTGPISDRILNKDELAWELIHFLKKCHSQVLSERLGLETEGKEVVFILEEVVRVRVYLLKGGDLDVSRVATLFLDDFRAGKLGWIALEGPENQKDEVG